jgi:hypothetical protein
MIPDLSTPSASHWPSQGPIRYSANHPFNYYRLFLGTLRLIRDNNLAIYLILAGVYSSQLFGFR